MSATQTHIGMYMKWCKQNIALYDTFIFDCDGVIWLSNQPISGAKQVLHQLSSLNKNLIFLSNNATKDVSMYKDKFYKLFGLQVHRNQIFTSAVATAARVTHIIQQIEARHNYNKIKILLIGSKGLYNTLRNALKQQQNGAHEIEIIWTRNDILNLHRLTMQQLIEMELDDNVRIVVASYDEYYGYNDIAIACRYLHEMKHEMHLIGTNDDVTDPTSKPGVLLPAAGSLLAALKSVTNIKMDICGKPHKLLFDLIKETYPKSLNMSKCLLIGDRLNTDIQFGINAGIKTALVMTGVTNDKILQQSHIKPDYVMKSVNEMFTNSVQSHL